jgi:four helix bundle protein
MLNECLGMRNFKSLKVWQKGHELSLSVYKITLLFPREETYGLISQLRRAASSVPANIAEGCGCNGNHEFARFLEIALRSASETEYYLLLAQDLKYLGTKTYEELNNHVTEIKRMLTKLMQRLDAAS